MNSYITIISTLIGSGVITTLLTLLLQRRKTSAEAKLTEASAKKTNSEGDIVVLTAQHDLLEKLLNKSQELVDQNEKLQKEYSNVLTENAKLRAEIVGHLTTISNLQQDTKLMRNEIRAIMNRVMQIDKHLEALGGGSNSNPFPE